ncbi:circularly permuted type 2 ATP-grasp protein [Leptothrix discophora]|uniref:Circularly permuted type 2 ATP-grasp protein n=1 Tax=Leptothrix discophora TaxID=89 RepID=A0ABT9G212_LEPDI|nr:circularly permuted type 2 ATP-grasp protein [Leptothrix discophora]MDP4300532.1 circularly permuted type 2 ATP-grasp protein [Leptothrix discophora]
MQPSLLSDDDLPDPAALAAAAAGRGTPGHYDELRGALSTAEHRAERLGERAGAAAPESAPTSVESEPAGPDDEPGDTADDPSVDTADDTAADPSDAEDDPPVARRPHGLAPVWQNFFTSTGLDGWQDLPARHARVQRRVRDDGATYNVYANGGHSERTWPLEMLPLVISAPEWARIERGVRQRARMLEAALADIYGPQNLLHEGVLPASLVLAHPQYLRPMHGVKPAGGAWLHLLAIDLARGPDGHWWVVDRRTQAPSGLGYLLENRLIIAQQFPEAFRDLKVQRVASAFRALMDGLMRSSPAGERSRIALLTPGPRNETYFEHVFLARYLGVSLVEGSDLTVRDQRLYLKTLHGLERVHVLLRRVDDEWLDPLELRPESALGVPGLLQAVRAGEVVLANAPGAGVLETPGLTAFWPGVARRLLGEELKLPATTSWWCGEASVWAASRDRLADYVIVPTFPAGPVTQGFEPVLGSELDAASLRAWQARIDANPSAYTLMGRVRPSEMPVWRDGRLEPRPVVLRVYAMSDGEGGWCVLPGGLSRVGSRTGHVAAATNKLASPSASVSSASSSKGGADVYLSIQLGSASTDTWVLTDGEVDPTSLLPRPLAPIELAHWHRVITSRSAENLFWLGRYTERAENTVRLARLALEGLPGSSTPVLRVLHALLLRHGLIGPGVPSPALPSAQAGRMFERALVRGLGDPAAGPSVAWNLRALRGCAEALRERLSTEHWAMIQELEQRFSADMAEVLAAERHEPLSDVLAVLAGAMTRLSAVTGAQTDRMTRDDGWRLLSVGRQIERLDMLAHALSLCFEHGLADLDDGFALMLGLFESTITYRANFQARREVLPLVHLLVLDTDNPRSLAWVARTMRDRLRKLARHDPVWAEATAEGLPQPGQWSLEVLARADEAGRHAALIEALRTCSAAALALSSEISQHLFSHVGSADRAVWQ